MNPMRTPAPSRRGARTAAMLAGVVAGTLLLGAAAASSQNSTPSSAPSARPAPAPSSVTTVSAKETFKVDSGHSVALFRVLHAGAGMFWGRFDSVTGTITAKDADPASLSFDITIDVNSVNTANTQRDDHLKSPDFFSAKEFPSMTFKSTGAKSLGGNFLEVQGDLTIRGKSKPITAKVEWTGTADGRMGRRSGFEATFTIDRGEFGVNYGMQGNALGRNVQVVVALEGVVEKK